MQLDIFSEPIPDWMADLDGKRSLPSPYETLSLRHYQHDAVARILGSLQDFSSTLCVMPTGTGKTQVAGGLCAKAKGCVLFVAHRDELIGQAAARFQQMLEEPVGIEQAALRADRERLVVASVQTLARSNRFERFAADHFELVIADEAHHYCKNTFVKPLEYFKAGGAKIVGVTATPDRGDERALGATFEDVSFVMDIAEAIRLGWLVPIRAKRIEVDELDISEVDTNAGDLVAGQLDKAVLRAVEGIVRGTLEHEPERQAIGFFPGVASAEFATARFNALKPGSACFISDKTPREERREIVQQFKAGKYQFLLNCMIATEGFDAPSVNCIIMGRPTKSRALYAQMLGRGTRALCPGLDALSEADQATERQALIAGSCKPDCMILDFVGNCGSHSLMTPADVLGGDYSDEEVELAKEKAQREPGADQSAMLASARAELELRRRHLAEAAAKLRSKAKTRATAIDPFSFLGVDMVHEGRVAARYGWQPMTGRQYEALRKAGFRDTDLESVGKREASKIFRQMDERRQHGLCTFRQAAFLRPYVPNVDQVSFERANEAISYVKESKFAGKVPFEPQKLDRILFAMRQPGEEG